MSSFPTGLHQRASADDTSLPATGAVKLSSPIQHSLSSKAQNYGLWLKPSSGKDYPVGLHSVERTALLCFPVNTYLSPQFRGCAGNDIAEQNSEQIQTTCWLALSLARSACRPPGVRAAQRREPSARHAPQKLTINTAERSPKAVSLFNNAPLAVEGGLSAVSRGGAVLGGSGALNEGF